jgi:hypothetical protein
MQRILILILCWPLGLTAQSLGGNAIYNFLRMPANAQTAALGGVNISVPGKDLGMIFQNPALLRPDMQQQASVSFQALPGGISQYGMVNAWHLSEAKTSIAAGLVYFNYGDLTQTDASGMILGSFRPRDYAIQATASRQYKEHWWYGLTLRFIRSEYGQYRSSGLAADLGINFHDPATGWQAALTAKNMGTQLSTYTPGGPKEELPFDLQLGVTKKLLEAPVQFSLSFQQVNRFRNLYNDTSFRAGEGDDRYLQANGWQRFSGHLVLGAQFFLGDKIELSTGYHFQRRQELNGFGISNGLNGFSFGTALLLPRLQFRYATGFYQRNLFHQVSLQFRWKDE